MLSPGDYYRDVPTDLAANLRFRIALLERCKESAEVRQAVRHMCENDIVFWLAAFAWQFNPRKKAKAMIRPFIPWDFQIEALLDDNDSPDGPGILWCIDNSQDLVIEKSRDMGISYLLLFVATWQFLFHPPTAILAISRSEDAVDKSGDHKSLFWKVDFILRYQPAWLLGGYDATNSAHRQKLLFSHPNGASIIGEASSEKSLVGGRGTWALIDEFSQIREAREILRRTQGTTDCRIVCGTHKGTGSVFAEICDPQTQAGSEFEKKVLHWSRHPEKKRGLYCWSKTKRRVEAIDPDYQFPPDYPFVLDGTPFGGPRPGVRSPWYDRAARRIGDERGVAEDLDINPAGSVSTVFPADLIQDLIEEYCQPPLWTGEAKYDQTGRLLELEQRPGGNLKMWIKPSNGKLPEGVFCGGADVAEGVGASPTCFTFGNAETGEKVIEYTNGKIAPREAACLYVALARALRDPETNLGARIAWERDGPGISLGQQVTEELKYRNVHMHVLDKKFLVRASDQPGWYPSPDAMDALLREYKDALRRRLFTNRSEAALKECLQFELDHMGHAKHSTVVNPKNPHHARINHGDHVVADALCWKLIKMLGKLSKPGVKEPPKVALPGSIMWRRELRANRQADSVWG